MKPGAVIAALHLAEAVLALNVAGFWLCNLYGERVLVEVGVRVW